MEEIFTSEEKEELLALRNEKKHRDSLDFAKEQLIKHGLSDSFATFVAKDSYEDTISAIKDFSAHFEREKQGILQLKNINPPREESFSLKKHRGIRRV